MIDQRRIRELNCTLVGPEQAGTAELACVFCHGFGAPGDDLVPLGVEFLQREPALRDRVLFVFPEAPLSLAAQGLPGGRAWWLIDMFKLQRAVELGEFRDLRREKPTGLDSARELLNGTIDQLMMDLNLPLTRIVLGGFSQGSMLATELTLRLAEKPAGLVIYSGTLLSEDDWRTRAASCHGLTVLQSHGRSDPLLPYPLAEELRDMLLEAGADVEFLPFPGMHTIPQAALQATTRLLKSLLDA
jgi:phospholipase/carboxylesterase